MTDPHWTSYVGMGTGIVGAILGYIGFKRAGNLKSLDMRLELRKAVTDLHHTHASTVELAMKADKSRNAVAIASGNSRSGRMEVWKKDVDVDNKQLTEWRGEYPEADEEFRKLKVEELESKLVEIHDKQRKVKSIQEKYQSALTEDDAARERIRISKGM